MTRNAFQIYLTAGLRTTVMALALAPTLAFAGPIHDAARRADIATVTSIAKSGAYINAPDTDGSTPLIIAALGGDTKLVEALIRLGADVKARSDRGMTALHAAAFSGDLDAFKLLEAAGADINDASNKFGVTPLILAAEEDLPAILAIHNDAVSTRAEVSSQRRSDPPT